METFTIMRHMRQSTVLFASLLVLAFANAQCVAAPAQIQGTTLRDADLASAPHAFQNFCRDRPDQCVTHGHGAVARLNGAALAQLTAVDLHVNRTIRPLPAPAGDAYQLGVRAGSCNEYAVEKRRELLARGWSAAALSLAVVRLPDGRGHLVLTVRTDHGDLVLDNLTDQIVAVDQTNYDWIERQSSIHPMLWVRTAGVNSMPLYDSDIAVNDR